MSEPEIQVGPAELVERIQRRLAARRAAGDLPLELEAELDRYIQTYSSLATRPMAQDRAREHVREAIGRSAFGVPSPGSGIAGLATRTWSAAMGTRAALGEVQQWRSSVEGAVVACIEAIDRFETDGLPAARDALAMVLDRLSALEAVEDAVADLEDRLAAVEARLASLP